MGKDHLSFGRRSSSRHRKKGLAAKDEAESSRLSSLQPPPPPINADGGEVVRKAKKKSRGARLWMRFDRTGATEMVECNKSTIIKRASVPARDLKILGPVFSHSSNILAREKAIVVSLEAIKLIVTAEEVLILDPLRPEVLSLVDRLKQQFPQSVVQESSALVPEAEEGLQSHELPFEFQVLEIALKVVFSFFDSSVVALETEALPVLDELTKNVSTENLDYVRSLKSNLTSLLARVQKVRDEIEHLLDDNKDMADLYLTRKWIQSQQQSKALVLGGTTSKRSSSLVTCNNTKEDEDVEDLEMLLEVYFTQLEKVRNKILTVREYIDDTEDLVNIHLGNRRNELLQMKLVLIIASCAIAAYTLLVSVFGMNIPCPLYNMEGIFGYFVWTATALWLVLFLLTLAYARWKKLLG